MARDRGERIVFRDHPSWRSRPGRHLRSALLAIGAGVVAGLTQTVISGRAQTSAIAPAVAAVLLLRVALAAARRQATLYTVTDRRVTLERGLARRRRTECPLTHLIGVTVEQTRRERLLRTGTVWFHTADGALPFHHVEEPHWLAGDVEALSARNAPGREPAGRFGEPVAAGRWTWD